jgi:hypothetical protein
VRPTRTTGRVRGHRGALAGNGADDWCWLELGRVLRAIVERHAADLRRRDAEHGPSAAGVATDPRRRRRETGR